MKIYLAFLIAFAQVFTSVSMAQTVAGGIVNGSYTPGFLSQTNYVKNPSAFKNLSGITASGGTLTRISTGGIENGYGISWTPTAAGQTLDFAMNTFDGGVAGQKCEGRVSYKGAGSVNLNARVRQNGVDLTTGQVLTDTTAVIPASPTVGSATTSIPFACGDGTTATVVRLTSIASGSAVIIGKVYGGVLQTALIPTNNLSDVASTTTARTNLGLGTLATVTPTGTASGTTFLSGANTYVPISKSNLNINYITDTDATSGSIGAWAAYANTAQALPVTGTGGTPTVTLTVGTTAPLIYGSSYYLFTHPASNTQGQGVSIPFTIDAGAQAKPLQINIPYSVASGTYSGGSPTTDSDLEAYVYDVTNAQVIQPTAFKLDCAVVGTNCQVYANFQAASNSVNYRLLLHNATTTTSAYTLKFANIQVTPNIKSYGVPASDLVSAGVNVITALGGTSPTKGTVALDLIRWGRFGDHARIKGEYRQTAAGSAGSGDYVFQLPAGLSFDSNKVTFYTTSRGTNSTALTTGGLGTASIAVNNSNQAYGQIYPLDATHFRINATQNTVDGSSVGGAGFFGTNFLGFANSGLIANFDFEAPIAGWSSNVQMSDQSGDNRSISAGYNTLSSTTVSTSTGFVFTSQSWDDTSSYNTTSGTYVVPAQGKYKVTLSGVYAASGNQSDVTINVNGVARVARFLSVSNSVRANGSAEVKVNAGDLITLVPNTSFNTGDTTGQVFFERLGGNTQTAIGESVNATYGLTTAQNVAANGIVKYDTKINDSHSAYSVATGLFTAPVNGMYRVTATYQPDSSSNAYVKVNGTSPGIYLGYISSSTTASGSASVRMLAGQTAAVYFSNAANAVAVNSVGYLNYVTFEKTGN